MAQQAYKVGDWLLRAGNPPTKWQVSRVIAYSGLPDHLVLLRNGEETDSITISVAVLKDQSQFSLLESAPETAESA